MNNPDNDMNVNMYVRNLSFSLKNYRKDILLWNVRTPADVNEVLSAHCWVNVPSGSILISVTVDDKSNVVDWVLDNYFVDDKDLLVQTQHIKRKGDGRHEILPKLKDWFRRTVVPLFPPYFDARRRGWLSSLYQECQIVLLRDTYPDTYIIFKETERPARALECRLVEWSDAYFEYFTDAIEGEDYILRFARPHEMEQYPRTFDKLVPEWDFGRLYVRAPSPGRLELDSAMVGCPWARVIMHTGLGNIVFEPPIQIRETYEDRSPTLDLGDNWTVTGDRETFAWATRYGFLTIPAPEKGVHLSTAEKEIFINPWLERRLRYVFLDQAYPSLHWEARAAWKDVEPPIPDPAAAAKKRTDLVPW